MIINLIRHGKTVSNDLRIVCGADDSPLSENGKRLLFAFKKEAIYPEVELCVVSALSRTLETKNIIFPDTPYEVNSLLNEINFGVYERTNPDEYIHDERYIKWLNHTDDAIVPANGESFNQFFLRVQRDFPKVIEDLYNRGYENVAIIGHGAYFSEVMGIFLNDPRHLKKRLFENGKGLIIKVTKENDAFQYSLIGNIGVMAETDI